MFKKIPGNVQEDSGECLRRFRECLRRFGGMLVKIPENVDKVRWYVGKDSRECSKRLNAL